MSMPNISFYFRNNQYLGNEGTAPLLLKKALEVHRGDACQLYEAFTVPVPKQAEECTFKNVIVAIPPTGVNTTENDLRTTYDNIFRAFEKSGLCKPGATIAIPPMSTGAGKVPPDLSARVAYSESASFLSKHSNEDIKVVFPCYGNADVLNEYRTFQSQHPLIKGNIVINDLPAQDVEADVVVAPMQVTRSTSGGYLFNYNESGPIIKKICQKVDEVAQSEGKIARFKEKIAQERRRQKEGKVQEIVSTGSKRALERARQLITKERQEKEQKVAKMQEKRKARLRDTGVEKAEDKLVARAMTARHKVALAQLQEKRKARLREAGVEKAGEKLFPKAMTARKRVAQKEFKQALVSKHEEIKTRAAAREAERAKWEAKRAERRKESRPMIAASVMSDQLYEETTKLGLLEQLMPKLKALEAAEKKVEDAKAYFQKAQEKEWSKYYQDSAAKGIETAKAGVQAAKEELSSLYSEMLEAGIRNPQGIRYQLRNLPQHISFTKNEIKRIQKEMKEEGIAIPSVRATEADKTKEKLLDDIRKREKDLKRLFDDLTKAETDLKQVQSRLTTFDFTSKEKETINASLKALDDKVKRGDKDAEEEVKKLTLRLHNIEEIEKDIQRELTSAEDEIKKATKEIRSNIDVAEKNIQKAKDALATYKQNITTELEARLPWGKEALGAFELRAKIAEEEEELEL